MSGYSIGMAALTAAAIGTVISIVVGAMASVIGDRPGEDPITETGHRAIAWSCTLCLLGIAALLVLEHLGIAQ